MKELCGFPCASGTLKLPNGPRPSPTAEGNFEQEGDDESEEGEKKEGSSNESSSMSADFTGCFVRIGALGFRKGPNQ